MISIVRLPYHGIYLTWLISAVPPLEMASFWIGLSSATLIYFSLKPCTQVSSLHRFPLHLGPKIYSWSAFYFLRQTNPIRVCLRNVSHNNFILLQKTPSHAPACFSSEPLVIGIVNIVAETENAFFDIYCPWEAVFVSNSFVSNQKLNKLRQCKEHFQKSRNKSSICYVKT